MAESNEQKVSGLLQQGLELYGTGDVARAFLIWNEVLEIDPGNEEALDYMRDADRRAKPRGDAHRMGQSSLIEEARRLLRAENEEAALELLSSAPEGGSLEGEAMIELLRATLFQRYRDELGDLRQVPRMVGEAAELQGRNLPPSAGFLLSMIDGSTSVNEILALSGMDPFDAVRVVNKLLEAGIVEVNP